MRVGLIASLAGHAAVLVWGLIAFPDAETFSTQPVDSLPVELVPIEEITRLQKGEKDAELREIAAVKPTETPKEETAKPAEKPAKEAQVQQPTPPTPEPTPAPEPAPPPEPEPEPAPAPEPTPEPEPAPAEKAPEPAPPAAPEPIKTNVVPRSKPKPPRPTQTAEKPKKDKFDTKQMSALLNKVKPSGGSSSASQDPASLGSRLGAESVRMSQTELDALRGQVARCWNPPVGAVGAEDLKVRVKFELDQSGEVAGSPEVLNSSSNPAFRAAASSAVRAVMRCAPYSLPASKYEAWKEVIINFDPRELIGG